MAKKPMPKSELRGDVAQTQSIPRPSRMPVQGTASLANPQRPPTNESTRVSPMEDYPSGRGGMLMVPISPAEPSAQLAPRPSSSIGARPPAGKMPTNS